MTTLAEHIIVAGAENRPPMLEKSMYDSWASRIRLFIKGKKHGRMMFESIDNGLLVYPTFEENGQTRPMKYSELTEAQQLQDDSDVQATNIILHGLPPDVFSQLINDMHTIGMTMQQVQVNTKFLNALLSEWSKFVTDVKLAKSLYTTNYDQLYAYLNQHEIHANQQEHSHKPKSEDSIQEKLYLLHMDLCGPMRVQCIIGRKYILVIVDDFSRFTWMKFLHSKDEVPDFIIKFIKMIQVRLNETVCNIMTDNGIEFVNQTLKDYYKEVRISHQTSVACTPQ
ncbi:retrovirus-related pol polyprotein from transposon TNT 1-94 [Tanacetum coccineum]|uniref:Retrovirus-related pol polyprotein from transposon TNT 1-94 n=1 Tax=Tanacetum coccineum TaxID=301880 RepID=A0ABQ5DGC2_9ASTR